MAMKRKSQNIDKSRRRFLGGAAALGGTGAVIVGSHGAMIRRPDTAAVSAPEPSRSGAYHETEHIRRYYETARG